MKQRKIIGIYKIQNTLDGKMYIGKSSDVKNRFLAHKSCLRKEECGKSINRHLFNAVKKHLMKNFIFEVIECCITNDLYYLAEREMYYMNLYNTTDRSYGYNLLKDSPIKTEVHEETKKLMSIKNSGENNPNFNNRWTDEMKNSLSTIKKQQHKENKIYNQEWKDKLSICSSNLWKDKDKVKRMSAKVSQINTIYAFYQYDKKSKELIKVWDSVYDILENNPNYKRHNIYAACSGEKPSMYGYVWKKELKI